MAARAGQRGLTSVRMGLVAVVGLAVLVACLPVETGGPTPTFGNDLTPGACPQDQPGSPAPCGPQPGYWAAINGPWALVANGDPYASRCTSGTADTCVANPLYRATGYDYLVHVGSGDVGRPLTVQGYDLGVYPRSVGSSGSGADCQSYVPPWGSGFPSGFSSTSCQTGDSGTPMNLDLQLFADDGNASTAATTAPVDGCHLTVTATGFTADPTSYKNRWVDVCTFTPTVAGDYPLRVRNSSLDGLTDEGNGINAFSLAVRGGSASSIRPFTDGSIAVNGLGARTYLAKVPANWAGHVLHIDLFDVGDKGGSGHTDVRVKGPPSGGGPIPTGTNLPSAGLATGCSFNAAASATKGPATPDDAPSCTVLTRFNDTQPYNNGWLRISIAIDPAYTCSTDCWWSIEYTATSGSSYLDHFVWSVSTS